jgi:N,N'-diacetyllegionaminate synthase
MQHTYVIAEIASAHDGDIEKAMSLINAAADAGADAVKAQFWSDADRLADRRRVPPHYREIYRRYQIGADWLVGLARHTRERGMDFGCTAYLPEDVATVAPLVDFLKVASFEVLDEELRAAIEPWMPCPHMYRTGKRVIVSLGMCDEDEAESVRRWHLSHTAGSTAILHCVSAYPCPLESLNLSVIQVNALGGFSDHTANIQVGAYAVMSGARIVEAHIRLNETDPANPDYAPALSPGQFRAYVANIRQAERIMGDWTKRIQPCEQEMAQYKVIA